MHPGRFVMEINVVQNYISDNFDADHKAVRSNLNFWAFLGVPRHKRGPLFLVAQGLTGDINRICVLYNYEGANHQNMLGTPIVQGWARFSTFSPGL